MTLDWFVPLVSISAAIAWLGALRAAMPALRGLRSISLDAWLSMWVALVSVAVLLAISSLSHPDLIHPDVSRFLLLMARAVLLVTGLVTWWELREVSR